MTLETVILWHILGTIIILLFILLVAVGIEHRAAVRILKHKNKELEQKEFETRGELSIYKRKLAIAIYQRRVGENPYGIQLTVDHRGIEKLVATYEEGPFDRVQFPSVELISDVLMNKLMLEIKSYVVFNHYYDDKLQKYLHQAVLEVVK